jgi:hypothetical protein
VGTGAAIALIGVGAGAVLGFASAQLTGLLRRKRRGRAAALLVWTELSRSEALAEGALEFGPGLPPVMPRFAFWEAHAAALAEVVPPDVLIDLEVAYGWAEVLGRLVRGELGDVEDERGFQDFAVRIRAGIAEGKTAIEPYAHRRKLAGRRSGLPEVAGQGEEIEGT